MHMTCAEAKSYLEEFIPLIKNIKDDSKVIIAPPFTAISTFSDHTDFDYLDISSQNIHWEDQGAFTAEISPKMLLEHGVSYASLDIVNQGNILVKVMNKLIKEQFLLNQVDLLQ